MESIVASVITCAGTIIVALITVRYSNSRNKLRDKIEIYKEWCLFLDKDQPCSDGLRVAESLRRSINRDVLDLAEGNRGKVIFVVGFSMLIVASLLQIVSLFENELAMSVAFSVALPVAAIEVLVVFGILVTELLGTWRKRREEKAKRRNEAEGPEA